MEKMRLDKYLSKVLGVSRSQVAHLVEKKMVLVNGKVAKKSGIFVEESDEIKILDSTDSQNLDKNNPRASANLETRPLRGAKNRIQGCRSATADFLLEAEKRGSPPKSEKRQLLARRGSGAGGAALLREESSEIDGKGGAESANQNNPSLRADSQNLRGNPPIKKTQDLQGGWLLRNARKSFGLPRSHSLARNDENSVRVAESSLDSVDSQNLPQIERLYEDSDILVLNKPPFLATHGAPSLKEPSLVEWLKAHKIQCSTISGELREGIVHRLDKQTSGALVVAKNNAAHQALSAQLADKTMTRLYLAIIDLPLKEDIEIECFLARNPKNRLKISKVDVRKYKKIAESSAKNPSLRADSQNLRGKPPCDSAILSQGRWLLRNARKSFGLPRSHLLARNDEFATDSQNLPKFARYSKSKFYKLLPSIDGKKELILARLFTGRTHQIRAHLESINRHIIGDELYGYKRGKGENYRVMLHAYLLELRHPKNARIFDLDSAESQNLVKNNPCEAPLNSPASWCKKSESKGAEVPPADFLLEAEKRGTPPKSEKRSFWRVGGAGWGVQPFCEKESSKIDGKGDAESIKESQGGLPRRFCESARNDNFLDSSLRLRSAQNDKIKAENDNLMGFAESALDSANLRFIAPLFDDMQDYLAKNFDMEKVNEILRTLPARAF